MLLNRRSADAMLLLLFILALSSASPVFTLPVCPAIPVLTCAGLSAVKCPLSYYNGGASLGNAKYPCILSGSTCTQSAIQCLSYCPPITASTCPTAPAATCESYYAALNAYVFNQCSYLPASNTCGVSTPPLLCLPRTSSTCSGTVVTAGCSSLITQATCTGRFQTGAHGGSNQCAWAAGVGCYADLPCR